MDFPKKIANITHFWIFTQNSVYFLRLILYGIVPPWKWNHRSGAWNFYCFHETYTRVYVSFVQDLIMWKYFQHGTSKIKYVFLRPHHNKNHWVGERECPHGFSSWEQGLTWDWGLLKRLSNLTESAPSHLKFLGLKLAPLPFQYCSDVDVLGMLTKYTFMRVRHVCERESRGLWLVRQPTDAVHVKPDQERERGENVDTHPKRKQHLITTWMIR